MAKSERRGMKLNLPMTLAVVLFYLILVTTYLIGGLNAKYLARDSAEDSARVIRFGELVLTETGDFGTNGGSKVFVPGVGINKDVDVSFGGSEATTFVFVKVDASGWKQTAQVDAQGYAQDQFVDSVRGKLSWTLAGGWKPLKSEGNVHVYYKALDCNQTLTNADVIKDGQVTVSTRDVNTRTDYATYDLNLNLEIDITAYAVQANGFKNATEAWESLAP